MHPCVNCPAEAVFHVNDPGANPVDYCRACLPRHLDIRANSGHFRDSQIVHGHKPDPEAEPKPAPRRTRTRKK